MSLSSALFCGVSGLNTLGRSMGVIGDNIANVNTIGFKSSRTTFETVLSQNIATASGISQIGRGVALSSVSPTFSQGSFESTNEPTDMAIGGKGFFMVRSLQTGVFYTRAGHFSFDENGYLVNPAGLRVQGWMLEPASTDPRGAIGDILIDATSSAPRATEKMDFAVNLSSEAKFVSTPATVKSVDATRSGFAFYDGVNDDFEITTDDDTVTVNLVSGNYFDEGRIYTGQEVAQALQRAINDNSTSADHAVSYSAATNTFTISAGTPPLTLNFENSTMLDVLGFSTTADTPIAAAGTDSETETAYNVTSENNTFTIAVDGNSAVTVVVDDGAYSIPEMRLKLEEAINRALAADGQSVTVNVRYDTTANKFHISSGSRGGTTSRIKLGALEGTANNFLPSIQMTDYSLKLGETSGSHTYPGFTESKASNPNRFLIQESINDAIQVGANTRTVDAGLYTGEELATAIETALTDDTLSASYDNITGRFQITNNSGSEVTVNWTDTTSTAAETLGFTSDSTIADGGTARSDNKVEFNIITGQNDQLDIIVNGNPATSGVPVTVTIDAGAYTADQLATELQSKINARLAAVGESETVSVTWDNVNKRMRIASSKLSSDSSIQLNSSMGIGTDDLIGGTLQIDDDTVNRGTGFQIDRPDDSSNYSTSLVVYDSLGMQHVVTMYFRRASIGEDLSSTWEWFAYVPADDTASGAAEIQARGRLTFSSQGILTGESPTEWLTKAPDGTPGEGFNFGGGAAPQQVVNIAYGLEKGINMSTQFSSPSSTIFQTQDGYASGYLDEVSVDPDGVISGHYSNGQVLYLARVALANFTNPWGLSREGGNLFAETNVSGQPITGLPGTAGLGKIAPNSLEQSNVDLSAEFVAMIIQQRGFQANSRIITTTDTMLQELINLKR